MATLKIYKTQIVPERNFLVQDIDKYLDSIGPTYTDTNFQFVKTYLDTSIKIDVENANEAWTDQAHHVIDNTSLTPMLGNYLSITETLDGFNKTFYYFIIGAAFVSDGTVSLQISLDSINTFSSYLYNTDNYTNQTNISRETQKRYEWLNNNALAHRYKILLDKHPESLDLSPACFKRTVNKTIQEDGDFSNINWYIVYKTNSAVQASGQNASDNIVNTYLVPSEALTLVEYSYTGDYTGIEAGYDGGYEPYTASDAGDTHGNQFDMVDYQYGGPSKLTTIQTRWQVSGSTIEVQIDGISTLAGFSTWEGGAYAVLHRWTVPYFDDQYERRWTLHKAFMSGQSPDNAGANSKLYITGVYYNPALNKYIAVRGAGGDSNRHPYIYSSNTGTFVDAGNAVARYDINFGRSTNTAPEYTQFDDPAQINLQATGNICSDIYNSKIWVYFPQDIKSIKSYNSNTGKYTDTFFNNPATGSTTHNIYKYVDGYDTIDRTDSKIIKIIRCPYCPVSYQKVDIQNGYSYEFEGFYQTATSTLTPNIVYLKKYSNPSEYTVDLESNTTSMGLLGLVVNPDSTINDEYLINYEPKLRYGQDTFIRKYAFDNQILSLPYEAYDENKRGLSSVKDDLTYMHTRELASDLLFEIKPDDLNNNAESYTTYDYGNTLLSSRNLEEPILNNDYLNYMRYGYNYEKTTMENNIQAQQLSTGLSAGASIIGGTAGGAMAGALKGGVPGAVVGAAVGLISGIVSTTSKIITMNAQIEAARSSFNQKLDNLRNQSTSVRSNNAVDLFDKYAGCKLAYLEYRPVEELVKPIANLYHYCGYAHPVQEKPNWCRYWFDFIQCSPVFKDNIFKNIYGNYQQDIIYRFENGVTVLHNRGYGSSPSYNWEQDKQNWETDMFIAPEIKSITISNNDVAEKNNSTRTIGGVTYYCWLWENGIQIQQYYTTSRDPSVGDTVYVYYRTPSARMVASGTVAHLNCGAGSTQLPTPNAEIDSNVSTIFRVSTSSYTPMSSNKYRYLLWVELTLSGPGGIPVTHIVPYPNANDPWGPTTYDYYQMDTDGVDLTNATKVGVQLVDISNIMTSSPINWVNLN